MDGVKCDKDFGVCMASGDAVSSKTIKFGGQFEVDLGAYELRKGGQPIKLGRIPMELLLFLIEQRGQLVTRDQIVEKIWGKDVFLDTDNSINAAIRRVRQVLEDNPDEPRYVQTVVGRGYRFIAAIHESGRLLSEVSSASTVPASALRDDLAALRIGPTSAQGKRWRAGIGAAATLAAILATGLGANVGGIRERLFHGASARESLSATSKARPSVAVLGFKNLSGKDEKAWISTAVAEMLGTDLAAGEHLRLIPGENVARMKIDMALPATEGYGADTLEKIRGHLSTDMVVLGSYLAVGKDGEGKVRLDLQLQDTRAGETIALISEDGSEADLAELVSRSGNRLRQSLKVGDASALAANDVRSALPRNPDAARFYSEGLSKLRSFDTLAARDLLLKAVAAEPEHALSHSALSESWAALGYDLKAQEEAKKAFELSSKLQREDQLSVEGQYRIASHEWPRATEIYRMLSGFFPDNLEYGLALARVQSAGGASKEALATVEALSKNSIGSTDDPRIDLAEAEAADAIGDFRRAEVSAARSAEKSRRGGERILTARALLRRGAVLLALGDNKMAKTTLSEAQEIFATVGDKNSVATTLADLAIIERHQSNLGEARRLLEDSLTRFEFTGNKRGMMQALNNLGNVLWDQGDMAAALHAHRQSLTISREIGSVADEGSSLLNIAGLLMLQGDLSEARQMNDESLQLAQKVGDQDLVANNLANIADVLLRRGELAEANKTVREALATERQVGNKSMGCYALQTLGTVLVAQGDLSGGKSQFEEAARTRHELGEKVAEAESQLSLAQIRFEFGEAQAAEEEARRTALIFHDGSSIDDEAMSYSLLAMALMTQGRSSEAQQAAGKSKEHLGKVLDSEIRFQVETSDAYVTGMTNTVPSSSKGDATKVAAAVRALDSIREKASRQGYVGLEMDARLRLGEVELRTVKANSSRRQLEQLQTDAQSRGFLLIARKAKGLLEQHIAEEVRKQEPSRPPKDH
jgi:DNA-binding winged helix-turn-helix (wHTH) protein/tetratricopeptide (TPR) repeat protein